MTTTMNRYTEETVEVLDVKVQVLKGGKGQPLFVFHHDVGNPGWLPFYDLLAGRFTVYVPSHPGFGKSGRPEWMRSVRELAMVYTCMLKDLKIERLSVVGLGFGGWVAAEMAVMCHHLFDRMVLVGPMGLQPTQGEILDQLLISTLEYVRTGFAEQATCNQIYGREPDIDQLEQWEINREMTTRIAFKPYMFDQQLPFLLPGVDTPTLIVWGRDDMIVPLSCGERYRRTLKQAELRVLEKCGHFVEAEQPQELAHLVTGFMAQARTVER